MFVRHLLVFATTIFFLLLYNPSNAQDFDPLMNDIVEMNNLMEEYFRDGDLEKIGELYLDDAYLLTPLKTVNGGEDITQYWKDIKNPVDWQLEVIEVVRQEEELYLNEYYEALNRKPPGWRQRGIELDHDKPLVYQLGHSTLISRDENGKLQESNVDFILIWRVLPNGDYRILLDTYTWQ